MSEAYLKRLTDIIFSSMILSSLFFAALGLFLLYEKTKIDIFFYGFGALTLGVAFYVVKSYEDLSHFRSNLYLFLPNSKQIANNSEPQTIFPENQTLKVCALYRNGATFNQIQKDMSFDHPTSVKRELRKGLGILLENYKENGKI